MASRRMSGRRRFRGRRRFKQGPRSEQFWVFTGIGQEDANGNQSCPDFLGGPGTQSFFPLVVEQQYAGFDPSAGIIATPFKQERVVVMRNIIKMHTWSVASTDDDSTRCLRWAIAKLDSTAVADPAYAFPSLFQSPTNGLAVEERVLQMGQLMAVGEPQSAGVRLVVRYDDLDVDLRLHTLLQVGESLWLIVEKDFCWAAPGGADAAQAVIGFTRSYCRE